MSLRRLKFQGDGESSIFSQATLEDASDGEIFEEIMHISEEPFNESSMKTELERLLECVYIKKLSQKDQYAYNCLFHFLALKKRGDLIKVIVKNKCDLLKHLPIMEFLSKEGDWKINTVVLFYETSDGVIESHFKFLFEQKYSSILYFLIKNTQFKFFTFSAKFKGSIIKEKNFLLLNKLLKYCQEERNRKFVKGFNKVEKETFELLNFLLLNYQSGISHNRSYEKNSFSKKHPKKRHASEGLVADENGEVLQRLDRYTFGDSTPINDLTILDKGRKKYVRAPKAPLEIKSSNEENPNQPSRSQNIYEAFNFFINNKMAKLGSLLCRCYPTSFINQKGLDQILRIQNKEIILELLDVYPNKVRGFLVKPKILEKSLNFLSSHVELPIGVRLFFHIRKKRLTINLQRLIMHKFTVLLENSIIFSYYINPALLLVMVSFTLFLISKKDSTYSLKLFKLAQRFRKLAKDYLLSQSDLLNMKYILMKKYSIYKLPLVEILYLDLEFFNEILTLDMIPYLISDKYNSAYKYENNYFVFCTAYNYLSGLADLGNAKKKGDKKKASLNMFDKSSKASLGNDKRVSEQGFRKNDHERQKSENNFSNIFGLVDPVKMDVLRKNNYLYQFFIYKKSFSLQTSIDLISYITQFIVISNSFHTLLDIEFSSVQIGPEVLDITIKHVMMGENPCVLENFAGDDDNKTISMFKACLQLIGIVNNLNSTLYTVINAMILTISISFKRFNIYLYSFLLYKRIPPFELDFFIDFFFFFMSAIVISLLFKDIKMERLLTYDELVDRYYRDRICLAIILMLMWAKFGSFFKISKYLGMLITSTSHIIIQLIRFVVIWIFLLMAFTSILNIILRFYYPDYSSYYRSFQTLLASSLKAFTNPYALQLLKDSKEPSLVVTVSFSLLFYIFLFLTVVILTNFFVAIMTTTYLKVVDTAEIIHSWSIYKELKLQRYNKYYGSLLIMPTPANLINLISFPFLILFKSVRLNTILTYFGYLFYLAINISIFSVCSLVFIIPLTWFKLFFLFCKHTIQYDIKRSTSKLNLFLAILHILYQLGCWALFGIPFFYFTFIINDMPIFLKLSNVYIDNRNKFPLEISYSELRLLLKLTQDYISRGMTKITLKQWTEDSITLLRTHIINEYKQEGVDREFDQERGKLEILKEEFEKLFETFVEDSDIDQHSNQNIDLRILEEILKTVKRLPKSEEEKAKILFSNYLRLIDIKSFKKAFKAFTLREERARLNLRRVDLTGFI